MESEMEARAASAAASAPSSLWPRLGIGRVLHDVQAAEAGDLDVDCGDVIILLRAFVHGRTGAPVFFGHPAGLPGQLGFIPGDAIETVQGSAEAAPPLVLQHDGSDELSIAARERARDAAPVPPAPLPDTQALTSDIPGPVSDDSPISPARPLSTALNRLSLRHTPVLSPGELVTAVAVCACERKMTLDAALHSFYTVEVATTCRVARVEKRYSDFRAADAQLRALFPDDFMPIGLFDGEAGEEEGVPPRVSVNLHMPSLMTAKRSAATMEARRAAVGAYLRQAIAHSAMCSLIVGFLLGKRISGAAPRVDDSMMRAVGEAALGTAFPFAAPAAGSRMSIRRPAADASSSPRGDGVEAQHQSQSIADVQASPVSAENSDSDVSAAMPPAPTAAAAVVDMGDVDVAVIEYDPAGSAGAPRSFTLDSMDAFDALLERGYAVLTQSDETVDTTAAPPAGAPRSGMYVTLSFTSLVWDGGSVTATVYETVSRARFAVDDMRDDRLPKGLHAALKHIEPRESGYVIVCGPDQAYGGPGRPPHVPTCAHIVYELKLQAVEGSAREMTAFAARDDPAPPARLGVVVPRVKNAGIVDDAMLEMASVLLGSSSGAGMTRGRGPGSSAAPPLRSVSGDDATSFTSPPNVAVSPAVSGGGHTPAYTGAWIPAGPAGGHGLSAMRKDDGGFVMPSPEDAERAFRAYLKTLEAQSAQSVESAAAAAVAGDGDAATGISKTSARTGGSGFGAGIQKFFARVSGVDPSAASGASMSQSASPTNNTTSNSEGTGGLFARIFKRGSSVATGGGPGGPPVLPAPQAVALGHAVSAPPDVHSTQGGATVAAAVSPAGSDVRGLGAAVSPPVVPPLAASIAGAALPPRHHGHNASQPSPVAHAPPAVPASGVASPPPAQA